MHAGLVLSGHAHNYVLVKVVNNASGTRLAGKLSTDWNAKPPSIQNVSYLYVPSLHLVQRESQ